MLESDGKLVRPVVLFQHAFECYSVLQCVTVGGASTCYSV